MPFDEFWSMHPTLVYCDGDSFDKALRVLGEDGGPGLAVLSFGRAEIESGLTGSAISRLMPLGDSADAVRQLADRVVLEIRDYDDDPREIYEIPACRHFFKALAYAWGGWLHFLEKEQALPLFLMLLADVEVDRRADGIVATRLKDPRELPEIMRVLFEQMNVLYAHHQLGQAACLAMTKRVGTAIDHMFAPS